jgi:hypothetical protein
MQRHIDMNYATINVGETIIADNGDGSGDNCSGTTTSLLGLLRFRFVQASDFYATLPPRQ